MDHPLYNPTNQGPFFSVAHVVFMEVLAKSAPRVGAPVHVSVGEKWYENCLQPWDSWRIIGISNRGTLGPGYIQRTPLRMGS